VPDLILREDRDGLATLTLNRPDKLNSLNVAMFEELFAHVTKIEGEEGTVGAVLVRGAGKCFCAGFDLSAVGEPVPFANFQSHVVRRLAALPQPVIAAVHGHCYAGGLEIALAADIVLASRNTKFADRHARWSVTPQWGMTQRLPRRVGRARAMEMMTTCRTIDGTEAAEIGLANACFEDEAFDASVAAFVRPILENSWFTHRAVKHMMDATDDMSLEAGLAYEVFYNRGRGPDMAERIAAFSARKG